MVVGRAWEISHEAALRDLASSEIKERLDEWAHEAGKGGRTLAYEKKGPNRATMVALLKRPGIQAWDNFTVPMSMREVEPGVSLDYEHRQIRRQRTGLDASDCHA